MDHMKMFDVRGGDGGTLELPGSSWPSERARRNSARKQTFYHQCVNFRLPNGSTVNLVVVITTRRKWEAKMQDQTGWTVIPILRNWVVVLQLMA